MKKPAALTLLVFLYSSSSKDDIIWETGGDILNLPLHDRLDIGHLSHIFDNKSESYKLFWFKAITDKVAEGETEMSFDCLINNMIADAWYMVTEYHLNLGPSDTLEKAVKRLSAISDLRPNEKKEKILDYLKDNEDRELRGYKRTLTLNVPYRLQAPFMKSMKGAEWHRSAGQLAMRINSEERLIYYFTKLKGLDSEIEVQKEWADYLIANSAIVKGWIELNLITYLQKRNPSVPGIVDKIYAPQERKLDKVKKYWNLLVETYKFYDIYGNNLLDKKDLSIDHFVPWSYVAHDELWNLHPTTKSINSSKSNNLPDWDMYFPLLGKMEYESYSLMWEYPKVHDEFEKCAREHINNQDVKMKLYREGLSEKEFTSSLNDIMMPVYQSAQNAGFGSWSLEI